MRKLQTLHKPESMLDPDVDHPWHVIELVELTSESGGLGGVHGFVGAFRHADWTRHLKDFAPKERLGENWTMAFQLIHAH